MKRLPLIGILATAVFTVSLNNPVFAENPVPKAPVAQNLKISPNTVAPGGTVNVSFEVIASSPLQSTASIITFSGPGGVSYSKIYMQSSGTNLDAFWDAAITIPVTAPAGSYDLSYSIPFDANGLSGGFAQKANALTVTGTGSAPTIQTVKNLSVSPTSIEPGQSVTVSFEIISSSPLQSDASIISFNGPGGVSYSKIYMRTSGTNLDGIWNAVVVIPNTAPSGFYDLSYSIPFDSNGLTPGFQSLAKALKVGTVTESFPSPSPTPTKTSSQSDSQSEKLLSLYTPKLATLEKIKEQVASWLVLYSKIFIANPDLKSGLQRALDFKSSIAPSQADLDALDLLLVGDSRQQGLVPQKTQMEALITQQINLDAKDSKANSKTKSTITCSKGKLTKKITGVNPKCPAGYKKK